VDDQTEPGKPGRSGGVGGRPGSGQGIGVVPENDLRFVGKPFPHAGGLQDGGLPVEDKDGRTAGLKGSRDAVPQPRAQKDRHRRPVVGPVRPGRGQGGPHPGGLGLAAAPAGQMADLAVGLQAHVGHGPVRGGQGRGQVGRGRWRRGRHGVSVRAG